MGRGHNNIVMDFLNFFIDIKITNVEKTLYIISRNISVGDLIVRVSRIDPRKTTTVASKFL